MGTYLKRVLGVALARPFCAPQSDCTPDAAQVRYRCARRGWFCASWGWVLGRLGVI
jgi:hypothetical protein